MLKNVRSFDPSSVGTLSGGMVLAFVSVELGRLGGRLVGGLILRAARRRSGEQVKEPGLTIKREYEKDNGNKRHY